MPSQLFLNENCFSNGHERLVEGRKILLVPNQRNIRVRHGLRLRNFPPNPYVRIPNDNRRVLLVILVNKAIINQLRQRTLIFLHR